MTSKLSKFSEQESEKYFVLEDRENELADRDGKVIQTFASKIARVLDLPNGNVVVRLYNTMTPEYGSQNIFALHPDGSIKWQVERPPMVRTDASLLTNTPEGIAPRCFDSLFFERGSHETRKRSNKYFEGAILAALHGDNNLYEIDMETGKIRFVRNTGSHDHV